MRFNFYIFWFPLVVYSGIIFYTSSLPSVPVPTVWEHSDKVIHVVEYAIFGYLAAFALVNSGVECQRNLLIVMVAALAFAYGASDEYHQAFVSGRDSSFADLLADVVGGVLGGVIFNVKPVKFQFKK